MQTRLVEEIREREMAEGVLEELPYKRAKRIVLSAFQKGYLDALLRECGGNMTRVAKRSGITRTALYRIVKNL